ncbi:MAG: ATPase [Tardiphaga sp.]|nr:ATPase [Tardiphaga sp.]
MRELFDEVAGKSGLDPLEAVRLSTRPSQRKKFYTRVSIGEIAGGYAILLDGRSIKTPSRKVVAVPSRVIAETIAAEWNAQVDLIDPMTMPMTRLANSVIDGVVDRLDDVITDIAKYFESDLLCYRAGHPQELVAREAEAWDGVLFWAAEALGAHFILAQGIIHATQPSPAVAAARAALPQEPWSVAAVHIVTTITGSALLALALYHDARDADQVWAAAHVDDDWNVEHWGVDEEVAMRRAARLIDFRAAADVIAAMRA